MVLNYTPHKGNAHIAFHLQKGAICAHVWKHRIAKLPLMLSRTRLACQSFARNTQRSPYGKPGGVPDLPVMASHISAHTAFWSCPLAEVRQNLNVALPLLQMSRVYKVSKVVCEYKAADMHRIGCIAGKR